MPSLEIVVILMLAAIGWLWLDILKAREAAIRAARAACESEGLILLDYTVAISRLKLARDEDGRLKLQRAYAFEYSDNGNNRLNGSVVLLGHHVTILNVGSRIASTVSVEGSPTVVRFPDDQ